MSICYICKKDLNGNNSSLEHIIPNALGGNLKSKELLCKDCNSKLGSQSDAELAKQLNFIANMLNIERDRGEPRSFEATVKDKDEKYRFLPGGKPQRIKPSIKVNKNSENTLINVIANNKKQALKVLKGLQKKYKITDDELKNIIESFEIKEEPFKKEVTFSEMYGGKAALKSIAKIVLNYYLHIKCDIKWISSFIKDFLNDDYDILSKISFMYLPDKVIDKNENEILHSILIVGDTQEKILYGYVELFNCYRVVVLLNDSYEGPSLKESYFFDVEERNIREKNYNLNLSKKELLEYLDKTSEQYKNNLDRLIVEMNNIMRLINSRQSSSLIDKISKDSLLKMESRFPQEDNPYITPDMISFLAQEISKKYVLYFMDIDR